MGHAMRRMWLGAIAVALAAVSPPLALAAEGAAPPGAEAPAPGPSRGPARVVTLVTGDQVVLHGTAGEGAFTFIPAAGRPAHGYLSSWVDGHLRVTPRDVASLVPDVLDPALFDITTLLEEHPESRTTIPLIWRLGPAARTGLADAAVDQRALESIGAEGVLLPKASADRFGAALVRARDARGALPERVWLDRRGTAVVDRNLEQVGAPAVWASGLDGSGVRIAILDSGVDDDHPDLDGKVVASRDFTESADPLDRTGHGTHVASIAAGTGAASGGERRGVAPGAQILDAKVIDQSNSVAMSSAIAGAEWAVANGADVVNMSLAFPQSRHGTDPLVEAVESLTRTSGALFVAAAGNESDPRSIGSPGTAPSALTVGAVDAEDDLADFSSRGPLADGGPLKPEITAPGVDVIAAATSHGTFGDLLYVPMSGTSMATPHVAGGAAIVRQEHPEWTPDQVKAALVGTAQEQPGAGVYDEGGGRMWLPDALSATVVPGTPAVDLGVLPFPQTGATLTRELSWTNSGDEPETIELATQLSSGSGTATVTPSTLSLAPGATGTATLLVETGASIGDGQHGGEVVATGGDVAVGIPFAFEAEPERYDLAVQVLDAAGAPTTEGRVTVLDVEDMTRFSVADLPLDGSGTGVVRVPPGTYHVQAVLETLDERDGGSVHRWVVEPEVTVDDRSTGVVLDARTTEPVEISVRGSATTREFLQVHERRDDAAGMSAYFSIGTFGPLRDVATSPTAPVTTGRLDTYVSGRVVAPQLRLGRVEEAPIPVDGSGTYVGRGRLRVVDVGRGTDAEIAAAGVDAAVAVVSTRGEPVAAVLRSAQDAGAAVVVLANDTDEPWQTSAPDVDVPAVTVSRAAAHAMVSRPSVRLRGSVVPDPAYHVVRVSPGSFPEHNRHVLSPSDVRRMVRVTTAVAALPGAGPATHYVTHAPVVPGFAVGSVPSTFPQPGVRRTDHLEAGTWASSAARYDGQHLVVLTAATRVLDRGDRRRETWFASPWRPLTRFVATDVDVAAPAVSRSPDGLNLNLPPFADADEHLAEGALTESGSAVYTVTVDGQRLEPVAGPYAWVPLPPGAADLEVQYDVDAGEVLPSQGRSRTVWRFRSVPPDEGQAPQPLLEVDLRLPIDLRGALSGEEATVRVTRPFGAPVSLRSLVVQVSTDGGTTWVPATTERTGPGSSRARLPGLPADAEVAVRVTALGTDGESIDQTLWEAARTAAG